LRIDNINLSVKKIEENLKNTYDSMENSLIESLSIKPAKIPDDLTLSNDTSVLLEAIEGLKDKLDSNNSKRVVTNSKVNMELENYLENYVGNWTDAPYNIQRQYIFRDASGNSKIISDNDCQFFIPKNSKYKEGKPSLTKSSLTKSCLNENPNENKTPK